MCVNRGMTRHNPPPGGPNAQAGSRDAGVTYGDPLEFGAAWPEHMRRAVFDYIERGGPMGGYLTHLFAGRVWSAVCNADAANYARFAAQCRWIAQVAPSGCYGTAEKVGAWIGIGGLAGLAALPDEEDE